MAQNLKWQAGMVVVVSQEYHIVAAVGDEWMVGKQSAVSHNTALVGLLANQTGCVPSSIFSVSGLLDAR